MTTQEQLNALRKASITLRSLSTEQKNHYLRVVADLLLSHQEDILAANNQDVNAARQSGVSEAMIDRLLLNPERLQSISDAVIHVSTLDDPVGAIVEQKQLPNQLTVIRERVPIGVIFMIYESRPNVTIDAASLAFKSGNAILLRGGSETVNTNRALLSIWQLALSDNDDIQSSVSMVTDQSHQHVTELLQQSNDIDLVIPRGGHRLIESVVAQSRIPVLKHFLGVCHCFVDEDASVNEAINLIVDGKLSRPSVCNALETLLVHQNISDSFWEQLDNVAEAHQLQLKGCTKTQEKSRVAEAATSEDFGREFLDKILAVKVVEDVNEAIQHIQTYGSHHTEVIVSQNAEHIERFLNAVDASVTMVNCSSRFSDGGELGLGAEIGISTTKMHAYGPMGLEALTIPRFVVKGDGQVRHEPYIVE